MPCQQAFRYIGKPFSRCRTLPFSLPPSSATIVAVSAIATADLFVKIADFICTHWGATVSGIKRPPQVFSHLRGPDHNHLHQR